MTLSVPLSPYGRVYCVVGKCKKRYDRTRHCADDTLVMITMVCWSGLGWEGRGYQVLLHTPHCADGVKYIKCSSHKKLAAIDTVQSHP